MPCRPSSAVQRCTQVPHAPSRPNSVAISWWYEGRLSSVSRFTIRAVRATSGIAESSSRHGSPPSRPSKVRPWLHGTYSCGNHSLASERWRSRLAATTGSSSMSSPVWSSATSIPSYGSVTYATVGKRTWTRPEPPPVGMAGYRTATTEPQPMDVAACAVLHGGVVPNGPMTRAATDLRRFMADGRWSRRAGRITRPGTLVRRHGRDPVGRRRLPCRRVGLELLAGADVLHRVRLAGEPHEGNPPAL